MEYEEARGQIAKEIFDVWKEAKEDCDDNWDDITFESLPEKHKHEYYLTVERLLAILFTPAQIAEWKAGGKVVVKARDQELPDKNANNTWYDDDYGRAGKVGWDLCAYDMLKANFRRVVE